MHRKHWRLQIAFLVMLMSLVFGGLGCSRDAEEDNENLSLNGTTYNAGLQIIDFDYVNPHGEIETITAAVWYPTQETPHSYTYHTTTDYQSQVAFNADDVAQGGPYPLVLFAHGAFGSGYDSAYFTEYLARHGYIVIAPDYIDTKPPGYTEQVAFSRIKGGNVEPTFRVLAIARKWIEDMNANRNFFISYLAEHRLNQTSFIIDKMLELNNDSRSIFYQSIKADAIGMVGHSEGGVNVIGKIGGHPEAHFKDNRIRAALVFSAPAYPFENNLDKIGVPIMIMVGDHDKPALGPNLPRSLIYDRAHGSKYYLELADADHFSFTNQASFPEPLYLATENNPKVNAICRYGQAFFQKYLKRDTAADKQLKASDPQWVSYEAE